MYLKLVALGLTALTLVPSGAHFFELPGKIGLERDAYFTVQGIYAGWAWFILPIAGAIIANIALYMVERRYDRSAAGYALVAALLIVVSLGVFFGFVFPGNQEYGHAASAVILFVALLATGRALIGSEPR